MRVLRRLRSMLGLRAEEDRDVIAEIEQRERIVAEKIAEKLETDAKRKLSRANGDPKAKAQAEQEMRKAERVRTREEDWLRVLDQGQVKRMYGLWRREND